MEQYKVDFQEKTLYKEVKCGGGFVLEVCTTRQDHAGEEAVGVHKHTCGMQLVNNRLQLRVVDGK